MFILPEQVRNKQFEINSKAQDKCSKGPYVSITTSRCVTCLGVDLDAELTFATHVKRVSARRFYQLRQLLSIWPALSADDVKIIVHALVASRVDYCDSISYQAAAASTHVCAQRCSASGGQKKQNARASRQFCDDLH